MDNLKNAGAKLLNTVADDAEIVKDIYDDGLKPAVQETGKALTEQAKVITRVGKVLNALWANIDIWVLKREYAIKETQKMLEEKLIGIPNEKIQAPENYIAVPALQALSYSMDNKELREMYANLLAKSMYTETAKDVTPAYVEIIKQLSPNDIRCFEEIFSNNCKVSYKNIFVKNALKNTAYPVLPFISELDFDGLDIVNSSIDNLLRMGLLSYCSLIPDSEIKKCIDKNAYGIEHINYITQNILKENENIAYEYKVLGYITLGMLFHNICCEEIN